MTDTDSYIINQMQHVETYDSEQHHNKPDYDRVIDFMGADYWEDKNIMDIGCGYGVFMDRLISRGIKPGCYIGIDQSKDIVNTVKRECPEKKMIRLTWPLIKKRRKDYIRNYNIDITVMINLIASAAPSKKKIIFEILQLTIDLTKDKIITSNADNLVELMIDVAGEWFGKYIKKVNNYITIIDLEKLTKENRLYLNNIDLSKL